MSKGAKQIPKQRAVKLFEQARLHLTREQFSEAERLLSEVAQNSDLKSPLVVIGLGDAALGQGRVDAAAGIYRQGLEAFPGDEGLHARLGVALARLNRPAEALRHYERAEKKLRSDPGFLRNYGYALLLAGRLEDSERLLTNAVLHGGGSEAKLTLALHRAKSGRFQEADDLCAQLEGDASPLLSRAVRALRAECRLFLGDAAAALAIWKGLRADEHLEPDQVGHMAYAAQLSGESELCDTLIRDCEERGPNPEDLLLFAQIANLRSNAELALQRLEAALEAPGAHHPGFDFLIEATRGRALRLLGRREEARRTLDRAGQRPEASNPRLGAQVEVDLGHLAAEDGDFEESSRRFQRALALDPGDPEAKRGLGLTEKRIAWRSELAASAEAKVEAARAETEAMRRHFASREGEMERLRRELESLRAAQRVSEEQARRAQEAASAREAAVRAERGQDVQAELRQREQEIDEKAKANLQRALGDVFDRCPPQLYSAFLVAETTFQKALYTELPAAAVAVLFAGALERTLYLLFVERFRQWLQQQGRLADFLKGAVRERRGKRVEYFDHFVEAFDEERPGRAPSMGEVGRVLQRRKENYLRHFEQFLSTHYVLPDSFYEDLTEFVLWAKEKLRDPVAHGRGIELGYEELKSFRAQLLFSFGAKAGSGAPERGMLSLLLN